MVANNVNHAKWATGETRSCFGLEFEEWAHWVKAILRDESEKLFISELWYFSFACVFATTKQTHDLPFFRTSFPPQSPCACMPLVKRRRRRWRWVTVSESRRSFINGFKLSAWWIARHIMAVLDSHLPCSVRPLRECTCAMQRLARLVKHFLWENNHRGSTVSLAGCFLGRAG